MENCIYYKYIQSPIGILTVISDCKGICGITFGNSNCIKNAVYKSTPIIEQAIIELNEYFRGNRKVFETPISLYGTDFQKKVWNCLTTIEYGQTMSYSQVAQLAGNKKACRAVGMANNRNPIPIIIPCHRVIGKNGALVGYAGGLEIKKFLLKLEGLDI